MKAARIHGYGGPEVFRVEEVERPACGPRQALVEVHATSINPVDWKIRKGYQRFVNRKVMPAIIGMDLSGVVVEVGAQVTRFSPGDAVYSSPNHRAAGSYAEFAAVDEAELALKPANMTHVEAATIPLVGLTAWDCLVRGAKVQKGERVFIEAGSGGVGTFAIQLARHLGATVATSCSPRNEALLRDLGADVIVDYTQARFDQALEPQDVVLEAMGGDSKAMALNALVKGGRLVSINSDMPTLVGRYGPVLGIAAVGLRLLTFSISARLRRGVKVLSVVRKPDGEALGAITGLIEQGVIKAVVDREFTLDQIAEAHAFSESGRARGKIAIRVR